MWVVVRLTRRAMELLEAVQNRKSIRKFKPDPVPEQCLREYCRRPCGLPRPSTPSRGNAGSWGEKRSSDWAGNCMPKEQGKVHPRADFTLSEIWKEAYMNRMRENGKGLFGLLGIDRQDKEKRKAFALSMHKFFGAPQVIFLCLDSSLGDYSVFDCGCFTQSVCLLAASKGLGTCIQHSGVNYPDIIRQACTHPRGKENPRGHCHRLSG